MSQEKPIVFIPANVPARYQPEALDPFIPFLKKYQSSHPEPQAFAVEQYNPDTLRNKLRAAVKGWLHYKWDVKELDFSFWSEGWTKLKICVSGTRIVLCPTAHRGSFSDLEYAVTSGSVGDDVLHHFTETPPQSIFVAFATLLSAEVLAGEVRFTDPVPKEWIDPFENIEFFQPEGKNYFVLV